MTHLRCPPRREGPQPPTPEAKELRRLREWAVGTVKTLRVEYVIELADYPTVLARFPFPLSEAEREELGLVCRSVRDALEPERSA